MMHRQRGLTMVELLVGLAISSFIIVGTVFVYSQSRNTYALNDTTARLQESGRFALGILEPDLQLAGYYGYSNIAQDFFYLDSSGTQYSIVKLQQSAPTTLVTSPAAIHSCGKNYAIDLIQSVQGTNGTYPGPDTGDCAPKDGKTKGYLAGTDTLTIRRASTTKADATPDATRLQLYVNLLKRSSQFMFSGTTAPGDIDSTRELRNLVMHLYYVSPNSDGRDKVPSLRRQYLTTDGAVPKIKEEEILPGVEDMQVEFGIDTGDHDSIAGTDNDANHDTIPDDPNGTVARWVKATDPLIQPPPTGILAQIVAVRVWLRIRADDPETAYLDTNEYSYADVVKYKPAGDDAKYRRVLVSRTIFLRNARNF